MMNPWEIWFWPWFAHSGGAASEERAKPADAMDGARFVPEDEWTTRGRVALELHELRLRDFSRSRTGRAAILVTPFALHDAILADLAPGHSLVQTLLDHGCKRLFLVEWASATRESRYQTIDSQLAALHVAIDEIGGPVDLIGLCQGGWLSLIYAARFPGKIGRLVLAGAPVDFAASALSGATGATAAFLLEAVKRGGDGVIRGADLLALWAGAADRMAIAMQALQITDPDREERGQRALRNFLRWHERTLDLPEAYFTQVLTLLYQENRLARGQMTALGRTIAPDMVDCPVALLAGDSDMVAPPDQVFAAARLVGGGASRFLLREARSAHLALFMGRDTLAMEWPAIAGWLLAGRGEARKGRAPGTQTIVPQDGPKSGKGSRA